MKERYDAGSGPVVGSTAYLRRPDSWPGSSDWARSRGCWPPRWARTRFAVGGFLMFGTIAGVMGGEAGQEYQALRHLRDEGIRTDATVVEIAGRSEEGSATSLTVRFDTSSGPVRAYVDVSGGPATDAKPGARIPVVYSSPLDVSDVRHADRLDGGEADGIRQGSMVVGLLAAGSLAGALREVARAGRQTEAEGTQDGHPRLDT